MRTYDLFDRADAAGSPRTGIPGSTLARFWELRGRRVFEARGVYWGCYRGPFFCSLPDPLQIDAEPEEIEDVLRSSGVRCLRFPSLHRPGLAGGIFVCRPRGYDFGNIAPRYRGLVRRGLQRCTFRQVDPAELLVAGLQVNRDTMLRQGRHDPEFAVPRLWKRFVDAIRQCPGLEVAGAYLNGRLSAYSLLCREDGWLQLLYRFSRTEDMAHSTNHALDYWIVRNAAQDPAIAGVVNSFVGLRRDDGLNRYKTHMGYEIVPLKHCYYVDSSFLPLLRNRATVAFVTAAWRLCPENPRLELGARILEGIKTTMNHSLPAPAHGSAPADPCQHTGALEYSRMWRPYPLILARLFLKNLKSQGLTWTIRKTAGFLAARVFRRPAAAGATARTPAVADESLGLQPGDWVEVKSEREILATLDGRGKNRGLAFVPEEMLQHCGRRYRVFKRVEKIYLEESRRNRKLNNTVLIEGVHCQGTGFDCDRACFLFWREAWLRRVDSPQNSGVQDTCEK